MGVHFSPMKTVTLSTKEIVHFGPWKRKAARLFKQTLEKGVCYRQDMTTGQFDNVKEIPTENFDNAYEAVLPILVQRIEGAGGDVAYTQHWLDDLSEPDYQKLEGAVSELKLASREEGEKNPGATAAAS